MEQKLAQLWRRNEGGESPVRGSGPAIPEISGLCGPVGPRPVAARWLHLGARHGYCAGLTVIRLSPVLISCSSLHYSSYLIVAFDFLVPS